MKYFSQHYPVITHISKPFRGGWGPGICRNDEFEREFPDRAYYGELTLCIYDMQSMFNELYGTGEDFERLCQEFFSLFNAEEADWFGMCSESTRIGDKKLEDIDYGIQPSAICIWEETFSEEVQLYSIDPEEEFHIDMLKLMVKRCMWDVLFPGEILPGYTEPTSGDLSLLDYSVMK
ncbi:hypothetical protein [Pseudoalteromonas viridis]|uniref:Uncharacterized protein n=1 Tax=Pseudoalteromonas viridis TaxID=339617 RepID=A0ABX7VCP4_9GAMM|nr:hypothetical protein [Pseudoalteromonas viridis]QTL37636.1 hypothetical protein J5X90_22625 [Pseudoalteromonas viridis]